MERTVLAMAERDGQLVLVTHRDQKVVEESLRAVNELNRICSRGWLSQSRVSGKPYAPGGERRYRYVLTEAGRRALA